MRNWIKYIYIWKYSLANLRLSSCQSSKVI